MSKKKETLVVTVEPCETVWIGHQGGVRIWQQVAYLDQPKVFTLESDGSIGRVCVHLWDRDRHDYKLFFGATLVSGAAVRLIIPRKTNEIIKLWPDILMRGEYSANRSTWVTLTP